MTEARATVISIPLAILTVVIFAGLTGLIIGLLFGSSPLVSVILGGLIGISVIPIRIKIQERLMKQ